MIAPKALPGSPLQGKQDPPPIGRRTMRYSGRVFYVQSLALLSVALAGAQSDTDLQRIRDEGLNRSQVMQTLSYLADVIGPRLTGSPSLKRANEWTRDTLTKWGLSNAHLEAWGPFGRGWQLDRFSAEVVEPTDFPLIAYPKAWSPGFGGR